MRQPARSWILGCAFAAVGLALGCGDDSSGTPDASSKASSTTAPPSGAAALATSNVASAPPSDAERLQERAKAVFGVLPAVAENPANPITPEKIELGRQLYYEARVSKNHDISCNTCHDLADYGIDSREQRTTSSGHRGALGDRNSPTVYNAALHTAQFWDGRAKDVEEQAKGPVLNPVEMAMPDPDRVLQVLNSIEGYRAMFAAAFPDETAPVTFDNFAKAVAAFERKLITPSRFDRFLAGDLEALDAEERRGLGVFLDTGCTACHTGATLGGQMFQKLGLMKPYPTEDVGRAKLTGNDMDAFFFKVPSLRNIAETGPYLHDGSIATLEEMVQVMAEYQTPKGRLSDAEASDLVAFLRSLTGEIPAAYIARPEPLPSSETTPEPDPS